MNNPGNFDLKDYISRDFNDFAHRGWSLIDIFLNDPSYYDFLLDGYVVDARAAYFIAKFAKEIINTKDSSKIDRNLIIFQLADKLLDEYPIDQISWDLVNPPKTDENLKPSVQSGSARKTKKSKTYEQWDALNIKCPIHNRKLRFSGNVTAGDHKSKRYTIPVLKCPVCTRLFTYVKFRGYKSLVKVGKKTYTNLHPEASSSPRHTPNNHAASSNKPSANTSNETKNVPATPCFTYSDEVPERCCNSPCSSALIKRPMSLYDEQHVQKRMDIEKCPKCGMVYLHTSIQAVNSQRFKEVGKVSKVSEPVSPSPNRNNSSSKQSGKGTPGKTAGQKIKREVSAKDFVIRGNTFRCHKKHHTIQEIDALVNVINRNGDIVQCIVSAGYCKECNQYFIRERTYLDLKKHGLILCRIIDEKTYKNEESMKPSVNGLQLAPQSILMQYGYNVKQSSNLTAKQRIDILKTIIDYRICSKDKVISHLDNMITLFGKQKGHKYDLAISKWKSDRNIIERYKIGSNRKVIVKTITLR